MNLLPCPQCSSPTESDGKVPLYCLPCYEVRQAAISKVKAKLKAIKAAKDPRWSRPMTRWDRWVRYREKLYWAWRFSVYGRLCYAVSTFIYLQLSARK